MKSLFTIFLCLIIWNPAFARPNGVSDLSIIGEIDDYEYERNYVEVSEEGLPSDHYLKLLELMSTFQFTLLQEVNVKSIFEELKKDSNARMKVPGGLCSRRRIYIQSLLKKRNVVSGKILIKCPSNNGRLRLRDQVSRRYITYINFHDTNIVAINTSSGLEFRIMDPQFQDTPISLHDYLTEIEANQRIRPQKTRGNTSRLCYWTISTSHLTY